MILIFLDDFLLFEVFFYRFFLENVLIWIGTH